MSEVKFTDRGIHQRIENWSELDESQRRELQHLSFRGLDDFLNKAEKLANDQLAEHGLPIDWPIPAPLFPDDEDQAMGQVMGWRVPDECEPNALREAHPNAEMAAKLKLDVHRCRDLVEAAEFRSKPQPKTDPVTQQELAREYMLCGVTVGLAYWTLLANVQFEAAVSEKRRRKEQASALSDEDYRQALREEATIAAAAVRLGVSERQIRNRIKKAEREQIRTDRNRKS